MKERKPFAHWSSVKALLFLAVFIGFFCVFAIPMGLDNMINTLMNTAYGLLINTALYLMAVTVMAGAISAILSEFGVVELLNKLLSPLMKPLYGLPGAAALGVVTTYLSDNPAILTLAGDRHYRACFRKYQVPALTNIGTAFGMGLVVTTSILGLNAVVRDGVGIALAVICGNLGAIAGSVLSTRLMLAYTKRKLPGALEPADVADLPKEEEEDGTVHKSIFLRLLNAVLNGGKAGVDLGLSIIPGVLVICTFVIMLTSGPASGGIYTGAANQGIALLPWIADKLSFILKPLFGFDNAACISVPITALGSAGAALGMVKELAASKLADCNDLAVFTAMCMCWSGYLSTHVSMMEVLKHRNLAGKAILFHTFGGLLAGVVAHWLYVLLALVFH